LSVSIQWHIVIIDRLTNHDPFYSLIKESNIARSTTCCPLAFSTYVYETGYEPKVRFVDAVHRPHGTKWMFFDGDITDIDDGADD
jgi:hypothetical protein